MMNKFSVNAFLNNSYVTLEIAANKHGLMFYNDGAKTFTLSSCEIDDFLLLLNLAKHQHYKMVKQAIENEVTA